MNGTFIWQNITRKTQAGETPKIRFWLNLLDTSGSTLLDDANSWAALDRFDVTNAQYTSIAHLRAADVEWRLRELDRQYALMNSSRFSDFVVAWQTARRPFSGKTTVSPNAAPSEIPESFATAAERTNFFAARDAAFFSAQSNKDGTLAEAVKRFKPQPYLHLAKTYRSAGYRSAARNILVRLERNETRYSDIGVIVMLWRWILDLTVQYGHALLRPIIILAVWAIVSATIFQISYDRNKIVPFKEPTEIAGKPKPRPVPEFNSLVFAIDTLLPIVDLNQKKNWTVNPLSSTGVREPAGAMTMAQALCWVWRQIPEFGSAALLLFNTFFGWLMTTLFVAGVSGLIRTNRD